MKIRTLLMALVFATSGCDDGAVELPASSNTIKAVINGKNWSAPATGQRITRFGKEGISVNGFRTGNFDDITIWLDGISAPGDYTIEGENEFVQPRFASYMVDTLSYFAKKGLISISDISQQKAKGTFRFTAVCTDTPNAPDTVTITNGEFDVAF